MTRFIIQTILIGISVAVFFVFTKPIYYSNNPDSPGIAALQAKVDSFNEALNNSKALENQRDALTVKKNAIDPNNLTKLSKLLPENIDNIRLVLEIEQIALPYGMVLKDVQYSNAPATATTASGTTKGIAPALSSAPASNTAPTVQKSGTAQASNKDYGIWDLSFSTTGTYNNFLNFTRDLENNLRIVDVSSIKFSSSAGSSSGSSSTLPESYKYDFKIKTYWLKN
mgnify:CR=1 FL=1